MTLTLWAKEEGREKKQTKKNNEKTKTLLHILPTMLTGDSDSDSYVWLVYGHWHPYRFFQKG